MDSVSSGRQRAREEKSRDFHDRLLSTAFSVSQPLSVETSGILSVRDKIAIAKHEKFVDRLDRN